MQKNLGEFKVLTLRETQSDVIADCPQKAADYWKASVESSPMFDSQKEFFVCLLLNTRTRIIGHNIVSMGGLDQVLIHPREVFRPALIAAAHSLIVMHNHPSGDPHPSEADIRITRDLIRAGRLLRVEILDHVIMGERHCSLKELGYFAI